jgi:hypothetical protein
VPGDVGALGRRDVLVDAEVPEDIHGKRTGVDYYEVITDQFV